MLFRSPLSYEESKLIERRLVKLRDLHALDLRADVWAQLVVLSTLVKKIRLLRIRTKARVAELYVIFSINTPYYIY